jgi:hypothetical protein
MARNNWQREELLIAFNLYCEIPFPQISSRNPKIVRVAEIIGRSPSALSMKLGNFARLDPALQSRGVKGLSHGGMSEIEIWNEFNQKPELLAVESEEIRFCHLLKMLRLNCPMVRQIQFEVCAFEWCNRSFEERFFQAITSIVAFAV